MAQGPYCIAAVLCEQIIEGKDNVLTPVRLVDQTILAKVREGESIPSDLIGFGRGTMTVALQLAFLVQLKSGDYKGKGKVLVRMNAPSGKVLLNNSTDVEFLGDHMGANLIFNLALQPEEPGLYWFDVCFDDRLLTRSPLLVIMRELSASDLKTKAADEAGPGR